MIDIEISCDLSEPVRFAADELRRYLTDMGVRDIRIMLAIDPNDGLSDEGYAWSVTGRHVNLKAGGELGLVFGVYGFLRDAGGCQFSGLGPEGEYVPQKDSLEPIESSVRREPKLWYRGMQFSDINSVDLIHHQIDWMAKNGFNYLTVRLQYAEADDRVDFDPATGEPVGGVGLKQKRITEAWLDQFLLPEARKRALKIDVNHHNLRFWLPPEKYLEDHPEWFALYNGKRGGNMAQLCICTSNDDAVSTLIQNVKTFLRRRSDVKVVGVIPEDGNGMCQCEACRALDTNPSDADRPHDFRNPNDQNQGLADRYARLINQVAKALAGEFPDVLVGAAAYVDAQWPSQTIKYEPNITLWFATYWRDASRPLCEGDNSHINALFVDLLKTWADKLESPLIEYGYYMGMNAQRGLPYPMARIMCEEWPHLKKFGVDGSTVQCLATCHDAYGLNLAAFAANAWADTVDYDELLHNYLLGMFGSAAKAIEPIYRAIEDATQVIARSSNDALPGGADESIMQPNGENAKFFLDHVPDMQLHLEHAKRTCQNDRERQQVNRFINYVNYWKLAAAADDESSMKVVIEYLESLGSSSWFAQSAPTKWRAAIARMATN